MTPARLAAIRVLLALDQGRTTLAAEVERERPDLADRRDQALFLELAAGTTRWRAAIDARLAHQSKRPVDDLSSAVRAILRLATYQIHHLDRIPAHAIVHESVEAAKVLGQVRASGFVNGVLRNMLRARRGAAPLPPRPSDQADTERALAYLSITLSHPRWLIERWLTRVGFDACERWCQFNNASPEIAVRPLDPARETGQALEAPEIGARPSRYVPGAWLLPPGALGRLPAEVRSGLTIQDEGSQLVACLAGARPGERILDVCAAPGGKTLILLQAAGPRGFVVAADRRPARVALLSDMLARTRRAAHVVALDAEAGLPFGASFDRVLLDAPCSGLGTLRRDPDIKWSRHESDLRGLAASQHTMLLHAAGAVRPGGALVYATCSSEPEENDEVVDRFLASAPEFARGHLDLAAAGPGAATAIDALGQVHTWPPQHTLDAFFAAVLVRRPAA